MVGFGQSEDSEIVRDSSGVKTRVVFMTRGIALTFFSKGKTMVRHDHVTGGYLCKA